MVACTHRSEEAGRGVGCQHNSGFKVTLWLVWAKLVTRPVLVTFSTNDC